MIKCCFRLNIRTVVGTFMAVLGTLQTLFFPTITTVAQKFTSGATTEYVWGYGMVTIVCGAMLLAWGEFCDKGDC